MLTLVGLGLGGSEDLTLRGRTALRRAHYLFAETYTTIQPSGTLEALAQSCGRTPHREPAPTPSTGPVPPPPPLEQLLAAAEGSLVVLPRAYVEEGGLLVEAARRGPTVLLVGGDPLSATTHIALRLEALAANVEVEVVPNTSILTTAPGLVGLDLYRFGRTTTLVLPDKEGTTPTSPLAMVQANLAANLHSLVLLDIVADDPTRPPVAMTANQGLDLLLSKEGPLAPESLVIVVARAGWPDCRVTAGPAGELALADFGPPPHTLLVPADLGLVEEEALTALARSVQPSP